MYISLFPTGPICYGFRSESWCRARWHIPRVLTCFMGKSQGELYRTWAPILREFIQYFQTNLCVSSSNTSDWFLGYATSCFSCTGYTALNGMWIWLEIIRRLRIQHETLLHYSLWTNDKSHRRSVMIVGATSEIRTKYTLNTRPELYRAVTSLEKQVSSLRTRNSSSNNLNV